MANMGAMNGENLPAGSGGGRSPRGAIDAPFDDRGFDWLGGDPRCDEGLDAQAIEWLRGTEGGHFSFGRGDQDLLCGDDDPGRPGAGPAAREGWGDDDGGPLWERSGASDWEVPGAGDTDIHEGYGDAEDLP